MPIETYSDIAFDISPSPFGGDVSRILNIQSIKQSLRNLVLSDRGDFKFAPTTFCGLKEELFELPNPITATRISKRIRNILSQKEPRVTVTDVIVKQNITEDGYNIDVKYYFVSNAGATVTNDTLSVFVERVS